MTVFYLNDETLK